MECSEEDCKVFYGKIEGINDLITFEGANVDELEEAFKYMVEEHIKDCKKEGIPVEKSYKGSLNVRLSPELHKKAFRFAVEEGVSLNQFIQQAVEHEINHKQL